MAYIKPQSPIMNGADYIYPITTADQIVVRAGENTERRLEQNGVLFADDSDKLGGKAPEYYIQPFNLLDNSDFRNPVNQREAGGSYGAWGGYTLDRWAAYANGATISKAEGGLSLIGGIYQPISTDIVSRYNGKTLTYAIKINGVIYIASGIVNQIGSWNNIARVDTPYGYINIETENNNDMFVIINNQISEAVIEWAALYDGEYTADTLPPYTPKGYANELLACKINDTSGIDADTLGGKTPEYYIQPYNLLDNSDFHDPVNQRGVASQNGGMWTPHIDRWMTYGAGTTFSVTEGGISAENDGTATCGFCQRISADKIVAGKTYTLAFYGSVTGTAYLSYGVNATSVIASSAKLTTGSEQIHVFTFTAEESTDDIYNVRIRTTAAAATMSVVWAALYEGSYTTETLPPYVPKGYANELLACKVYDTTGVDADTLGGKAPEYYLATQELLASSNYARGASVEFSAAPDSYTYIFGRLKYVGTPHSVGASGGSTRQFQLSSVSGDDNYVYINTALFIGEQYGTTFLLNNIETTTINKSTGAISVTQPGSIQVGPIWGVK